MKAVSLFLMFSISSAMGVYYGYSSKERSKTIEELINFLKYLVIRVSTKNGDLLNCINTYKESPRIEEFLSLLTDNLISRNLKPFEKSIKGLTALNKEELEAIKNIDVGMMDYGEQIKTLEQAIICLEAILKTSIDKAKGNRVVSYSGVLLGLALVIIFI